MEDSGNTSSPHTTHTGFWACAYMILVLSVATVHDGLASGKTMSVPTLDPRRTTTSIRSGFCRGVTNVSGNNGEDASSVNKSQRAQFHSRSALANVCLGVSGIASTM